jgi:hypothetical protein
MGNEELRMFHHRIGIRVGVTVLFAALWCPLELPAAALESQRMERAKDLIADEHWVEAIDELKAAATDPKEPNKDEALFWLAHSQHQARDAKGAVETIRRLERRFPASRYVKPARSLRVEIAQRLRRNDVLWWHTVPPAPPTAPVAVAPHAPAAPMAPPAVPAPGPHPIPAPPPAEMPRLPHPPATAAPSIPPPPAQPPAAVRPPRSPVSPLPPPPALWVPEGFLPDTDLRIQALGSLIRTDGAKVIPMLKEIALDAARPNQARRALFVLVESGRPEARRVVIEAAKTGPEPIRLAAVRELGRLGGSTVSSDLLQVYENGSSRVKQQVVTSLGHRDDAGALMRIAESEKDRRLRDFAIVALGQARGSKELFTLYGKASADAKRPIILGLFQAEAEDELIRIAESERDQASRREVLLRLRLLGTPKAMHYVELIERK